MVFCYGSSSRLTLSCSHGSPQGLRVATALLSCGPQGSSHPLACSLNPPHPAENSHFIEFSVLIPCEGVMLPTGAGSRGARNYGPRVYPKRVGSHEGVCISLLGLPPQSTQTGGLKRNLASHHSACWTSKMKSHQSWFLLRPLSMACGRLCSPRVFTWSCLCACL